MMRGDDGRKLDHKTLEELRFRAVHEQGAYPEEGATTLGLCRSAVYGWLAAFREGSWDALRAKPLPDPRQLAGAESAVSAR